MSRSHDELGDWGSDMSRNLRIHLARVGIDLDERKPKMGAPAVVHAEPEPIDRAKVRELLVLRGAPARDLEWLTASSPSVEAAAVFAPYRAL